MIVQSFGALQQFGGPPPPLSAYGNLHWGGPSQWWHRAGAEQYAQLYATQPNVRIVIDFLARNIAQLGVHAFRRVADNDRERLAYHDVVRWLAKPNPGTTQYRLIESLMIDIGIYFNAFWFKLRDGNGDLAGLVRLPPATVTVEGWLIPSAFVWTWPDGTSYRLDPRDVCFFGNYDPHDPVSGLSPLETLRQLLAEEGAATDYRESFWQNAARLEGVIERPINAPRWTKEQKAEFRTQWQSRFAGAANAGQTAVLDDGMTFKEASYSARDSEFTASRKLSREECARAYHMPLPMVGLLDHATFSNIKEQHKQLYQDALGPWLTYLVDEFERQLLIESTDQEGVYFEFNIAEKLKGSFEEQAAALQTLCGRPVMTANEGRARLNLPSMKDDPSADQLSAPLNTSSAYASKADATPADVPPAATAAVIRASWDRQRKSLERHDTAEHAAAYDVGRWDRELAADLEPLYLTAGCPPDVAAREASSRAARVNADTLTLLVAKENAFSTAREAALYG